MFASLKSESGEIRIAATHVTHLTPHTENGKNGILVWMSGGQRIFVADTMLAVSNAIYRAATDE